MNDVLFRTAKCFIFAFLGVLIPELCALLSGSLPSDLHSFTLVVIPMFCAALSSGLSAGWNFLAKYLFKDVDISPPIEVQAEYYEEP